MTLLETPAKNKCHRLTRARLVKCILRVLATSAVEDEHFNKYDDDSCGYKWQSKNNLWTCERVFRGGGISKSEYTITDDEAFSCFTTITYRRRLVWLCLYTADIRLPELRNGNFHRTFMYLCSVAASQNQPAWHGPRVHYYTDSRRNNYQYKCDGGSLERPKVTDWIYALDGHGGMVAVSGSHEGILFG